MSLFRRKTIEDYVGGIRQLGQKEVYFYVEKYYCGCGINIINYGIIINGKNRKIGSVDYERCHDQNYKQISHLEGDRACALRLKEIAALPCVEGLDLFLLDPTPKGKHMPLSNIDEFISGLDQDIADLKKKIKDKKK